MNVTDSAIPWLLMVFSLPARKASERVQIWRKLQKVGAVGFRNAGYLLPNTPDNLERFEWISTSIRAHQGEASVLRVHSVDDLSVTRIQELFRQAREPEYLELHKELRKLKPQLGPPSAQLLRLAKRFHEIAAIDFYGSRSRRVVEELLEALSKPEEPGQNAAKAKFARREYQRRVWVTRPRPGIDRVSSAWLITRFIDPKARFVFAEDPARHPAAVPFDTYQSVGFGHDDNRCTFETLCRSFGIRDKQVLLIGKAVHDADFEDERYGRSEGIIINSILRGWERQNLSDRDLLKRGMDLIEGLYVSLGAAGRP